MTTVHIIGGGLAGLSCALKCQNADKKVVIYEASPQAGGRCRSYFDTELDLLIDNGSHILLGGNSATLSYLNQIGSRHLITEIRPAKFPFLNIKDNNYWEVTPPKFLSTSWLKNKSSDMPKIKLKEFILLIKLGLAGRNETVRDIFCENHPLYPILLDPLSKAALNTSAADASALLLWKFLKKTLFKGEKACRPMIFENGLSPTLIDPTLQYLQKSGTKILFQTRIKKILYENKKVKALKFPDKFFSIQPNDSVVLAVPPDTCSELLPELNLELQTLPIVNVHFRINKNITLPGNNLFLGLIGSKSQWIFIRDKLLSVTISSAKSVVNMPNKELVQVIWDEIQYICKINQKNPPPWRVIKEKKATIAQTPIAVGRRPMVKTLIDNLFIAGDWTNTGLPATIEGSILSGNIAANEVIKTIK
ncbi:MAG: hypothetical protein CMM83_04620 [Rhodospirillales bacterium]|nr:hypothetical protein [Rhodospirillales bacterium]